MVVVRWLATATQNAGFDTEHSGHADENKVDKEVGDGPLAGEEVDILLALRQEVVDHNLDDSWAVV